MPVASPPGFSILGVAPRLFRFVLMRQLAALPNGNRSSPPGASVRKRLVLLLALRARMAKDRSSPI